MSCTISNGGVKAIHTDCGVLSLRLQNRIDFSQKGKCFQQGNDGEPTNFIEIRTCFTKIFQNQILQVHSNFSLFESSTDCLGGKEAWGPTYFS